MAENSEEVNTEKDYSILLFRELRKVRFFMKQITQQQQNMAIENIGEEQGWKVRESEQCLWMKEIWGMRPGGKVRVR